MALSGWPAETDDDGSTQSGTIVDKAFMDTIRASIEAACFGITAPNQTPGQTTDEVIAARGSLGSLANRLNVFLNADGTPKATQLTNYALQSDLKSQIGRHNICSDSLLALWPDGDTSAPYGWTLTGAGAAIVRTGTGGGGYEATPPGDATKMKFGKFAAKITRGSADARLTKNIIPAAYFPTGLQGKKVAILIRGFTNVSNQLTVTADDGVSTTQSAAASTGAETIVSVLHTFSNTATKLDIYVQVAGSGSAYFSDVVVVVSDQIPTDWFPERWGYYVVPVQQSGNATVANQINETRHIFEVPAFMVNTRLQVKTAPATQAIIVRPAKGTGTYPYSTNPSIAAAATSGTRRVEGTYANRCFKPSDLLTWDITQVGVGTVGAEVNASFVFLVSLAELDYLNE